MTQHVNVWPGQQRDCKQSPSYTSHVFPSHPLWFPTISFYDLLNESEYPPSVASVPPLHTLSLLFLHPSLELRCKARREECGNVDAIWKSRRCVPRRRRAVWEDARLPSPPPAFRCFHPQRKPGRRVHFRSKIALPGASRGSLGLAFCVFFSIALCCGWGTRGIKSIYVRFPGSVTRNTFQHQEVTLQSREWNSVSFHSNRTF